MCALVQANNTKQGLDCVFRNFNFLLRLKTHLSSNVDLTKNI